MSNITKTESVESCSHQVGKFFKVYCCQSKHALNFPLFKVMFSQGYEIGKTRGRNKRGKNKFTFFNIGLEIKVWSFPYGGR